jgi:hypothetical protein
MIEPTIVMLIFLIPITIVAGPQPIATGEQHASRKKD